MHSGKPEYNHKCIQKSSEDQTVLKPVSRVCPTVTNILIVFPTKQGNWIYDRIVLSFVLLAVDSDLPSNRVQKGYFEKKIPAEGISKLY